MQPPRTRTTLRRGLLLALALGLAACSGGRFLRQGLDSCAGCDTAALQARLILIGDAGENEGDTPVLRMLSRVAAEHPERTHVVFLGDNVYPLGLALEEGLERDHGEGTLRSQMLAVQRAGAAGVFIPGNHDWARKRPGGMERVLEQGRFVAAEADDPVRLRVLPTEACPGPVAVDVTPDVRVIVADTVWLLEHDDPRGTNCVWGPEDDLRPLGEASAEAFYAALQTLLQESPQRHLVFAAHHPLKTRGPHGGFATLREWLFPFTVAKSWLFIPLPVLYPLVRYQFVRSDEDLVGEGNREMVQRLQQLLRGAGRPVLVAGGHEHSLQVFDDPADELVYLVSGSGVKTTAVGRTPETLFKDEHTGFGVLDVFADGTSRLSIYEPRDERTHEVVFTLRVR